MESFSFQSDSVTISPGTAVASELGSWKFVLHFGEDCYPQNQILIQLPRYWQLPRLGDSTASGYTTLQVSRSEVTFLATVDSGIRAIDTYPGNADILRLTVETGTIFKNDSLIVIYGDKRNNSPGLRAHYDAHLQYVYYKVIRSGSTQRDSVPILILPKKAISLSVSIPTTVLVGRVNKVKIAAVDSVANPDWFYRGTITLSSTDSASTLLSPYTFQPSDSGVVELACIFRTNGVQTITVSDDHYLSGISNPAICDTSLEYNIWWGDVHTHTILSGHGYGLPDDLFRYAKKVSMLDWVIYTEHDYFKDADFRKNVAISNYYNRDDEFATLNGYEWSGSKAVGHLGVYYGTDNPPYYSVQSFPTVSDLVPMLTHDHGIAHVAHPIHTYPFDWSGFDSTVIRNAEMVGSGNKPFEFRLQSDSMLQGSDISSQLFSGKVFGFVGATDNHHSRPATVGANKPGGLTAAIADRLTRGKIFDALENRHVYATTGKKIYLAFYADDALMGSIVQIGGSAGKKIYLRCVCVGTSKIDSLIIIKNGVELTSITPDSTSGTVEIPDSVLLLPSYYYVRVVQHDRNKAWSSPIWFVRKRVTDSNDNQGNQLPEAIRLSEGYPNPFNPTIRFHAQPNYSVIFSADIYDVFGKKVRTLFNHARMDNQMEIAWDGRDEHGKSMATGVYFLRLQTPRKILIRKALLLR